MFKQVLIRCWQFTYSVTEKAACGGNILSHLSENYGFFFFAKFLIWILERQNKMVLLRFVLIILPYSLY